jgi:hypothetical protein
MAKKKSTIPKTAASRKVAPPSPMRRYGPWIGGALVLVVLIAAGILIAQPSAANSTTPGERVPVINREHIDPGTAHPAYNSDPPTSGWHYPEPLKAGFYDQPQADEAVIHNLEHGHIAISYDCSKLTDCQGTKDKLRKLFDAYRGWKIVIVPRVNKDAALALTAWGWIDKLNEYDEARIRRFIDAYRDHGPEQTME